MQGEGVGALRRCLRSSSWLKTGAFWRQFGDRIPDLDAAKLMSEEFAVRAAEPPRPSWTPNEQYAGGHARSRLAMRIDYATKKCKYNILARRELSRTLEQL